MAFASVQCWNQTALDYISAHANALALEKFQALDAAYFDKLKEEGKGDWTRHVALYNPNGICVAVKIGYTDPNPGNRSSETTCRDFDGYFILSEDGERLINFHKIVQQKTVSPLFVRLMFYYMFDSGIANAFEEQFGIYKDTEISSCIDLAVSLGYIVPKSLVDGPHAFVATSLLREYIDRVLNTPFYNI